MLMIVGNSIDCNTRLFLRRVFLTGGNLGALSGNFLYRVTCTEILWLSSLLIGTGCVTSKLLETTEILPSYCCILLISRLFGSWWGNILLGVT